MRKKLFSTRTILFTIQIALVVLTGMVIGAVWRLKHPFPKHHTRHSQNCSHGESQGAVTSDATNVRVITRRDGDRTRVIVKNLERSEITMTFDFRTVNLKAAVKFPHTATFEPGETEAFVLEPENDQPWEFAYTNHYKIGSSVAVPDDYLYALPYAPGTAFKVTQAFGGSFSHTGSNKYAIDWKMPEGTPIYASRGGLVVKVKDDSDRGGGSIKYDRFNNYVLIRHDDGTLGHYCHLLQNGVRVFPGQTVRTGELIALSGNTGFSSGPHLHFCVFKTVSGRERVSIPVKFKSESGSAITLLEGRKYRAPEIQQASSEVVASAILQ